MLHADALLADVRSLARAFAADRRQRQQRRSLDPADVDRLKSIGLHLAAVPQAQCGLWQDTRHSLRTLTQAIRLLAQGDASLAVVASMHFAVLTNWRDAGSPATGQDAWEAQRRLVFGLVKDGAWWGTATSEPGSGGDIAQTRAIAEPDGKGGFRISGEKHFASGSGATTHVLTSARRADADGASLPIRLLRRHRGKSRRPDPRSRLRRPHHGTRQAARSQPSRRLGRPGR